MCVFWRMTTRYEDLLERMPRSEAAEIEATVAQAARRLCPGVQCQVIHFFPFCCFEKLWSSTVKASSMLLVKVCSR